MPNQGNAPKKQTSAEKANYPDSSSTGSKDHPLAAPVISVTFQNFTINQHTWVITDLGNNQVVFSGTLNGRDDPDPNSSKVIRDIVSDGVIGNAQYQKEDDAQPTKALQLTNDQTVLMT